MDHIAMSAVSTSVYDIDSGVLTFPNDDGTRELGQKVLADARKAHARFLKYGTVGPALLKGVIHLAQLDAAYRSGFVYEDENLGVAAAEDLRDLRNLLSLVLLWQEISCSFSRTAATHHVQTQGVSNHSGQP
ncbi:MAG: hypothetical protein WBE92_05465, partial [Steroidobacteraceae bacterium]